MLKDEVFGIEVVLIDTIELFNVKLSSEVTSQTIKEPRLRGLEMPTESPEERECKAGKKWSLLVGWVATLKNV